MINLLKRWLKLDDGEYVVDHPEHGESRPMTYEKSRELADDIGGKIKKWDGE